MTWGRITDLCLLTLDELGCGTAREVADAAGLEQEQARKVLGRIARNRTGEQRCHISAWTREELGQKSYPRPIFAPGPGRNAPKPKARTHSELSRNSYRAAQAMLCVTHPGVSQKAASKLRAQINRAASNNGVGT